MADFVDGHSANRIIPELQHLEVGDIILMGPGMGPKVAVIEPNRALVLHGSDTMQPEGAKATTSLNTSWVFYLKELDSTKTRIMTRFRVDYNSSLLNFISMNLFLEPISFMMERKMLLGIKKRAEAISKR